ncbi:MAG: hypothetical protein QN159_08635 [Armatimonadota bacterium]|nr:hypothetical protein [Armatimonadota bacterium]
MASRGAERSGVLDAVGDVLWRRLPAAGRQISGTIPVVAGDGQYLCAWPVLGALAPLLALAVGAALGSRVVPSGTPFTASLVTVSVLFALGGLGAGLGVWALVGYALGDLLFGPHVALRLATSSLVAQLVWARIPQLGSYVMLALLMVGLPLAAQTARLDTSLRLPLSGASRTVVDAGLHAILLGGFGMAWALAAAPLIRPLYTWVGLMPDVRAIAPLQQQGQVLAIFGAAVGVARVVLEDRALRSPIVLERMLLAAAETAPAEPGAVRRYAGIVASTLVTTLLAAGVLANLAQGVAFGLAVAGILVARDRGISRIRPWLALTSRLPIVVRLAAGLGVTWWASQSILQRMYWIDRSFLPLALVVLSSVAAFALLFPPAPPVQADAGERVPAP